jgi:hypothetical protein
MNRRRTVTHDEAQPRSRDPQFTDIMGAFALLPLRTESAADDAHPAADENEGAPPSAEQVDRTAP